MSTSFGGITSSAAPLSSREEGEVGAGAVSVDVAAASDGEPMVDEPAFVGEAIFEAPFWAVGEQFAESPRFDGVQRINAKASMPIMKDVCRLVGFIP